MLSVSSVQAVLLPVCLPANVRGKAAEDGPRARVPFVFVGDRLGFPAPGSPLDVAATCGVNQRIENLSSLSLSQLFCPSNRQ